MALNLIKKMQGFVLIQVEGYFSERFLNLALNQRIVIWDIKKVQDGRIIAKVAPKEFKKLRAIAKITKCRVKILKKRGVPFVLLKYKKRKVFALLVLVTIVAISIYNSYIWKIDIVGDFTIPIEEVKKQLSEENLNVPVKKKDINIDSIKLNMSLKRNDLAWIGVSVKGTKATVEIVEKVIPNIDELNGIPCNIVASKDGIITKIYARDGIACVEKDDLVQKGQILISGIMKSDISEERYVHADGEVYAKTWYTYKSKIPYEKDLVVKTGKIEKAYSIELLNCKINLLNNSTNFEKYDTIKKTNQFRIFNRFLLPIEVEEIEYREVQIEKIILSKEQAKTSAQNEAMNKAIQLVPSTAEVLDNFISAREYDDGIEVEVTIECIEKIGTKEKLEG